MKIKNRQRLISLILLIIILLIPICSFAEEVDEFTEEELIEEIRIVSNNANQMPNINSRFAIVIDRKTGEVLYSKNSDERTPMASTTKILTAIIVLEHTNLAQQVTVSKKAANIGGSRLGLRENDEITMQDLLYGLMLCSGNDTAVQIAETIGGTVEDFADIMNQKAKEIGLENSHFVTPHGLDAEEHYTTAYDMAILTKYALDNERFAKFVGTKSTTLQINGNPKTVNNTNELLGYLDGVYGVKTGFTNGAGRCLVTACKRGNSDFISVVLGADTKRFRTQDSIKILEYCFKNYEQVNIQEKIQESFEEWKRQNQKRITVSKGMEEQVEIELEKKNIILFPVLKEEVKDINVKFNANFSFEAPVYKGTKIGILELRNKEAEIITVNILVSKTIEKRSIFDYMKNFLSQYKEYISYNI